MSDSNVPRIPLGFSEPYEADQYEAFRAAFIDCATAIEDPAALFDTLWPRIKAEALRCQKIVWLRKERRPDSNYWRGLTGAVEHGDVQRYLKKHPYEADALLYGAMRAGIIAPSDGVDYIEEFKALAQLGRDRLHIAIEAAKAPGSVLNTMGRPPAPIDEYAVFLVGIYREVRGTSPRHGWLDQGRGQRRGPGIRFFTAAMAPFRSNLGTHGIYKLIARAEALREK